MGSIGAIRPRHLINHFEGHRELSRKDELVANLKTQLLHEGENVFDYTPITFHVVLPEGKQPSLEHFFKKFLAMYDVLNYHKYSIIQMNKQMLRRHNSQDLTKQFSMKNEDQNMDTSFRKFGDIQ